MHLPVISCIRWNQFAERESENLFSSPPIWMRFTLIGRRSYLNTCYVFVSHKVRFFAICSVFRLCYFVYSFDVRYIWRIEVLELFIVADYKRCQLQCRTCYIISFASISLCWTSAKNPLLTLIISMIAFVFANWRIEIAQHGYQYGCNVWYLCITAIARYLVYIYSQMFTILKAIFHHVSLWLFFQSFFVYRFPGGIISLLCCCCCSAMILPSFTRQIVCRC